MPAMGIHISVLPKETLALLAPRPGELFVDATTGLGGHTLAIAQAVGPTGRVLAIDQDETMLTIARERLIGQSVTCICANFETLPDLLAREGLTQVDGVLADLGFCSDQVADANRGFSFQADGPLDMRLDPHSGTTAADLVNTLSEGALADIFFEYGEERKSRWVAKRIVERRATKRFETTSDLADLVRRTVPRSGNLDPATRVFQALRIAVNEELGVLERLLAFLPKIVKPGGRVGIISFHSLEDRLVKNALYKQPDLWEPLTKKPVEAGDAEVSANPRSRSAKLRCARRVTPGSA
ncbi:MAG: 16S rRNA (cytosine(1402)-N(4))-methyltransferase RsmH [Fimbriiglobus sp.]